MDHRKFVAAALALAALALSAAPAAASSILPITRSDDEIRSSSLDSLPLPQMTVALTADQWTNEPDPLREMHWGRTPQGEEGDAHEGGGDWGRDGSHDWSGDDWNTHESHGHDHGHDWDGGGWDGHDWNGRKWEGYEWWNGRDWHGDHDHGWRDGDSPHWPGTGTPKPVPLPDALRLLLSGLGSLLLVARRTRGDAA